MLVGAGDGGMAEPAFVFSSFFFFSVTPRAMWGLSDNYFLVS